jgi:hypothetical protein
MRMLEAPEDHLLLCFELLIRENSCVTERPPFVQESCRIPINVSGAAAGRAERLWEICTDG